MADLYVKIAVVFFYLHRASYLVLLDSKGKIDLSNNVQPILRELSAQLLIILSREIAHFNYIES